MLPPTYLLDRLRKLRGSAEVSYPTGTDVSDKRVERVVTVSIEDAEIAFGTADEEYTDCLLVYQQIIGADENQHDAEVYRRYEKLPATAYTTQRVNARGDTETVTLQRVAIGTAASPNSLLQTESIVTSEDGRTAVKITVTVASHSTLTYKRRNERGDEVVVTDQIVAPGDGVTSNTLTERKFTEPIDNAKVRQITETTASHSTLTGKRMASEAQGEVATIADTIVAPDATEPTLTHLHLDYRREPITNARSRQILTSVASFPVLIDDQLVPGYEDAVDGSAAAIRIRTTKQVIAAPADPTSTFNTSTKLLTEYQALDKLRSIQITSKLTSLPVDRVYYEFGQASFPDVLASFASGVRYPVSVSDSSSGDPIAVARYDVFINPVYIEGYSGSVRMKITEKFRYDLPGDGDLPTPLKWWPQSHDIYVSGPELASPYYLGGSPFSIRSCLHGTITATAGTTMDPSSIAATTPATLPYGTYVVKDAAVESWRLGAKIWRIIEMEIPPLT